MGAAHHVDAEADLASPRTPRPWPVVSSSNNWTFTSEAESEGTGEVVSVIVASSAAVLRIGATQELTATAEGDEGIDESVIWFISDETVATISAAGLVTAVAGGSATMTATSVLDDTVVDPANVTVIAPAVMGVVVDPAEMTIEVGSAEVQLMTTVSTARGATDEVT